MQANPESLAHQAIVGEVQEDPSPNMEHIQSFHTNKVSIEFALGLFLSSVMRTHRNEEM